MSGKRAVIVELIGLPGSGKTWAATELARQGWVRLEPDGWRKGGLWGRLYLMVRAPIVGLLAYTTVALRRPLSMARLSRVFQVQRAFLRRRSYQTLQDPVVADEGALHAIFIATFGSRTNRLARLAMRWLVGVLVRDLASCVHLDPGHERVSANLRSRDQQTSRFDRRSDEKLVESLFVDSAYRDLVVAIRHCAGSAYVRVPTSSDAVGWLARSYASVI